MKEAHIYHKTLPFLLLIAMALSACGEQKSQDELRAELRSQIPPLLLVGKEELATWTNIPSLSLMATVDDGGAFCAFANHPLSSYENTRFEPRGRVSVDGKPTLVIPGTLNKTECKNPEDHTQTEFILDINLGQEGAHKVKVVLENCVLTDLAGEPEEICGQALIAYDQTVNLDMTPPTQQSIKFQPTQDEQLNISVTATDNGSLNSEAVIAGIPAKIDSTGTATVTINPNLKDLGGTHSEVCDEAKNCSVRPISELAGDTRPPDFSLKAIEVGNPDIVLKVPFSDKDAPLGLDQLTTVNVKGAEAKVIKENNEAKIVLPPETDLSQVSVEVCDLFQHCLEKSLAILAGDTQPPKILSVGEVTFSQGVGSFDVVISDDSYYLLSLSNIGFAGGTFPVTPFKDADGIMKGKAHISFTGQPLGPFSFTFAAKDAFKHASEGKVDGSYNPCPTGVSKVTIGDDGRTVTLTIPINDNLDSASLKSEGEQERWPGSVFNLLPFLTKVKQTGLQLEDNEVQITFTAPTKKGDLLMRIDMETVDGYRCSLNYKVDMPEVTDQEKMAVYWKLIESFFGTGMFLSPFAIRKIRKLKKLHEEAKRNYVQSLLVKSVTFGTFLGDSLPQIDRLPKKEQRAWLNAVGDVQILIKVKEQLQEGKLLAAYENFKKLYKETPKDFLAKERERLLLAFIGLLNDQIRKIIVTEEAGTPFSILKKKEEIAQMEELIACLDDLYSLSNNHNIWRGILHKEKQEKSIPRKAQTNWELTRSNIEKLIISYHYVNGDLPMQWARLQARFKMADNRIRDEVERQLNL